MPNGGSDGQLPPSIDKPSFEVPPNRPLHPESGYVRELEIVNQLSDLVEKEMQLLRSVDPTEWKFARLLTAWSILLGRVEMLLDKKEWAVLGMCHITLVKFLDDITRPTTEQ